MDDSIEKMPRNPVADDMLLSRIEFARSIPPELRMQVGLRLFDLEMRRELAEIRQQNPDLDEAAVKKVLSERMRFRRQLAEEGIYFDVEEEDLADLKSISNRLKDRNFFS